MKRTTEKYTHSFSYLFVCERERRREQNNNVPAGELILGLSTGLAEIGECDRGDVVKLWCPPSDNRCMATAALLDGIAEPPVNSKSILEEFQKYFLVIFVTDLH